MLAEGKVDAVTGFSFSSFLNLVRLGVPEDDISTILMADHGLELYGNAIIVNTDFASENPDVVKGFLAGVAGGWKDVIADPAMGAKSVIARNPAADLELEQRRLQLAIDANVLTDYTRANGMGGIDMARMEKALTRLISTVANTDKPVGSAPPAGAPTALIDIRSVSHTFHTDSGPLQVLDNLNLSVQEGCFTAVVGPSGCGKSTLTRLVAGLLTPDSGEVWLHGERVIDPRSSVGMAFQNPVLLEWRTILANVMLPLEIVPDRVPKAQHEQRARELLALVGLESFEDKKPSELSGGMRQRASLCRALIHKPDVIILDEPFGALDAFTREDLWQTMHALRAEEPFTALLITHDLRESVFLSDEVVVLSGRPARAQYVLQVPKRDKRTLDDLYTQEAVDMLSVLRHQIQLAQGRTPEGGA